MTFRIIEYFDVLEGILPSFFACCITLMVCALVLHTIEKLSCGALSQQQPFLLIDATVP